ncbi:MAG: valine--tRNA ligase [Candidatus Saccharibacteria bacterium]
MKELPKAYNPSDYEAKIYTAWEESGAFKPDMNSKKAPFTIIMPPPNANGDLHTGHGMFVVEDILTRFKRMQGHPTLWLPGTDHAGIETQVVYERILAKEGKSRFDLGREKFYDAALDFTLTNQPKIINQLRSLGFSADWSRLKFTLDQDIIDTVYATFKQMHADGHIYRGNRIVNWCTSCQSSFADIEVKHIEREDAMYTLDYGTVQIATTRPETIFADAAVAVNPEDSRFNTLIGQTATIPLVDRPIAVIGDAYVSLEVGTGALKVTPAHDTNDYEIGLRHNLPEISIVDLEGKLVNVPQEFAGLSVEAGRKAVVAALEAAGKLIATTPLTHSVGIHDRCSTVIEPLITEQWYLRITELNQPVITALESDEIKITPARFKKTALDWLRNEHDWNIGRQNWFGIRIPVYYKTSNDPAKDAYLVTADEAEAKAYYGEGNYRAETDVFDTWFSSGQWPFATLQSTGDFDTFYPTSVMMTARDILTKWVTRMVMFGSYRTGKLPYGNIYLWGMVNDAHGKKMSKSKGNVINPLEMTDKYGTDALRLALTIGITPGNDGSLSEEKILGYRNFCNKLWNVARYTLSQLEEDYSPTDPQPQNTADAWILNKLNDTVREVTVAIEEYRFSEAGQMVYSLLWNDFADWYIEASKVEQNTNILYHGLVTILKLVHPFAPFVSEAIWEALPATDGQLISANWPEAVTAPAELIEHAAEFDQVLAIVTELRSIKTSLSLNKLNISHTKSDFWTANGDLIAKLTNKVSVKGEVGESGIPILSSPTLAKVEIDSDTLTSTIKRLEVEHKAQTGFLKSYDAKLANTGYVDSAPAHIVEETRARREETLMLLSKLDEQLSALKG